MTVSMDFLQLFILLWMAMTIQGCRIAIKINNRELLHEELINMLIGFAVMAVRLVLSVGR